MGLVDEGKRRMFSGRMFLCTKPLFCLGWAGCQSVWIKGIGLRLGRE